MNMNMNNNYSSPNFQAKFMYSDSLKQVVDYAVEHGKINKLNEARKKIDSAYLTRRIKMDINTKENGCPEITFYRFVPKNAYNIALTPDDYVCENIFTKTTDRKMNPLKYALEIILKLSHSAPENKLYKSVVVKN